MGPQNVLLMGIASTGPNANRAVPVSVNNLGQLVTSGGGGGGGVVPTVFKSNFATAAGTTAIWTPAAGKKFNLMGYQISVSGTLAVADTLDLTLEDGATGIFFHEATLQTTVSGDTQIGVDFGGGFYVSLAANNVLGLFLSAAITNANGGACMNAWGFES